MKKMLVFITGLFLTVACSNNPGESGTVNDGFKGGADANGALSDSSGLNPNPTVDTAVGNHRVDTERRDTLKHQ